jgi:hypothetical protein
MGARRVGVNITQIDGQPRKLPLLEFRIQESS